MTVAGLLSELGMAERRIAVARNGEVVPKSSFDKAGIDAGDRIEILEAVGGG
ncbi:MAG: thiamine biosynthesis protein ThiS [bacterium TMED88]|nr:thiamine biosynthesis protein ThiS [Deltaproteobacteria bacterium]OUV34177.1 MAG: thiamine biosynthesis protein ThiS [bacterium TMED88]